MKNILTILITFLMFLSVSNADIKLEFSTYEKGNSGDSETSIAIFTSNKMKIESRSNDGFVTVLFDGQKDKMIILNHEEKNYMVFTKELINNLSKQVSGMMEQMKQQFANLPDAQRKQMEKMMESQLGSMKISYTVDNTGETKKINNWNTTKYNLKANEDLKSEIWAAPYSTLGVSKSDISILGKFSNFSAELLKAVPSAQKDSFSAIYDEIQGLPVMSINSTNNNINELKSISQFTSKLSDFEIPSDYNEKKIPMPGNNR